MVLAACSTAQAAPFYANETALECDTNSANRATDIVETAVGPGCPAAGTTLTPAGLVKQFASYYAGTGFDSNFLTWAPVVPNYDPGGANWAACGAVPRAPVAQHLNQPCPVSFHFGPVSGNLVDPRIHVLLWDGAFVALACGNFSEARPSSSPVPTVSGTKFDDRNGNGVRDPGEAGLGGVVINLLNGGTLVGSTTTAPDGSYSFALDVVRFPNRGPGTYTLSEDVPSGYHQTAAPGAIVVNNSIGSQTFAGNDFGNAKAQPTISTVPSSATHVGATIFDTATLSGGASPSGAVDFKLYAPGDTACTSPIATARGTLSGATAVSSNLVSDQPGIYRWVASYPGDGSNYGATSPCGSETVQLYPPITATPTSITGIEGAPLTATVANFTDPDPGGTAAEYAATIKWADGTPATAGTISQPGGPGTQFSVVGSHVYAEEAPYGPTVTITDVGDAFNTATANSTANIGDARLSATGVKATSPQGFNGPVATFTDANTGGTTADFTATIDWGDGSGTSAGIVSGGAGSFSVAGSHTYTGTGFFTVTVKIVDDGGSTATATSTLLIYGTANGGNFVIGDKNAANGTPVTFWGAQWWKLNSLSGGSGPASFKGFEDNPAAASCRTAWTTDPSNSTPPPTGPLPAYMAVIVSSTISKSGSTIAGNTVDAVVVKTDSGYAPNPGHAGTGTVVAQIC